MIKREYQHLVFAFFMALLMSFIMSFVVSVFNIGIVNNIIEIWFKAWGFAFCVAFPVILLISPTVRQLSDLVIESE